MARQKGRPPARTTTIADCGSIAFHENPTPQCPHGLLWWESDGDLFTDELQAKMCREPGCKSNEYHPHEGESITLRDERTFGGRKPLRDFWADVLAMANGGQQSPDFEDRLRGVIERWVLGWTWTGIEGEPLPLPSVDWDAVSSHLEYAELLWIAEAALRNDDPRKQMYRPLAPANGKGSPSG